MHAPILEISDNIVNNFGKAVLAAAEPGPGGICDLITSQRRLSGTM